MKAASVSETELIALGGRKDMILLGESRRQTRIIFGGVGETRLIFTPEDGLWKLDANPSLEELKRELARSGRGLWDNDNEKADIAFQAVDALLTCSRDWQDFSALPKSKQKKADVYRAMVNAHLAMLTTLQALERDTRTEAQK